MSINRNILSVNKIRKSLNNNHKQSSGIDLIGYDRAGVLIPFFYLDDDWKVLFTRRTETLQNHKGQVAFPGGAYEPGDTDLIQTALRESCEEIGLCSDETEVLGCLEDQITVSNFRITPVVAYVDQPIQLVISKDEVSRVFCIPLAWLANPDHRRNEVMIFPDGNEHEVIFYQLYDGELLWGVTASIVVQLLEVLNLS